MNKIINRYKEENKQEEKIDTIDLLRKIQMYGIKIEKKYLDDPEKYKYYLNLAVKNAILSRQKQITQVLTDDKNIDENELRYIISVEMGDLSEEEIENILKTEYNWIYYKALERRKLVEKLGGKLKNNQQYMNNDQLKDLLSFSKNIKIKTMNNMLKIDICNRLNKKINNKYNVEDIYIHKLKGTERFRNFHEDKSISVKLSGEKKKFYKANKIFENILCKENSLQEGNRFTYGNEEIVVGYLVNEKPKKKDNLKSVKVNEGNYFIIQDENMHKEKMEIIRQSKIIKEEQIDKILNKKIDQEAIDIASSTISRYLSDIANLKDYSSKEEPYIKIAIKSILNSQSDDYLTNENRETIGDLFEKLARTIVYLNYKEANIFHKKIANEYYIPELVLNLPESEKFPEIFNSNITEVQKEIINSYIHKQIKKIIREMASVYDPTLRRQNIYIEQPSIYYDKKFCENSDDVKNINKENTILYRDPETGKVYCFNIDSLVSQFDSGNFINKYTGNNFDKNFIRKYTIQYYDSATNSVKVFVFKKLYDRFKKGNYKIPNSSNDFDKDFIDKILLNKNLKQSFYFRGKSFEKQDFMISMCVNSSEMLNSPVKTFTNISLS
jgi:hypothetical protein